MAQIIKTTGEVINVSPKNGKVFELEEMQAVVSHTDKNGVEHHWIEAHILRDGRYLICNEEGKLIGCDINVKASQLFRHSYHDTIVGDVLVCDINEID
jgi:hypothetical protein